jgi:hypothetical protein
MARKKSKKSLNALIRERMKKTGESFTAARAHIIKQGNPCPSCGGPLSAFLVRELYEPDEDDGWTDGQLADFYMECETGIGDNWHSIVRQWFCPHCEPHFKGERSDVTGPIEIESYPVRSSNLDDDEDDL